MPQYWMSRRTAASTRRSVFMLDVLTIPDRTPSALSDMMSAALLRLSGMGNYRRRQRRGADWRRLVWNRFGGTAWSMRSLTELYTPWVTPSLSFFITLNFAVVYGISVASPTETSVWADPSRARD